MARRLFDSSVLIRHWRDCGGNAASEHTPADARDWGSQLIEWHGTDAILSPVYVEFVSGVTSGEQLRLARAFLSQFDILDGGDISADDWDEARRLAERIPKNSKRRQLGDCLVRAIANRLRYQVITFDKEFPR